MQQQAQPVVVEVAEAVADSLHLLHQQVDRLGGAVGEPGGMPGQDLWLPAPYGAVQMGELMHVGAAAVVVEALEAPAGC